MSARKGTPNARKGKAMTLWRGTYEDATSQTPGARPLFLPHVDRETIAAESAAAMRLAREILGEPAIKKPEPGRPKRMPVFA